MLKQRILTALVLIPLVLWAIISLPDLYYAAILAVIVILGAREWSTMARLHGIQNILYVIFFIIALYSCWIGLQRFDLTAPVILYAGCTWWLYAFIALVQFNKGQLQILWNPVLRSFIGLVVLLPTFVALYVLRTHPDFGAHFVIYLLVLIWLADSAAYFSGKRWGKNKLLPNVSPGKTWQGVFGALFACISFSIIYGYYGNTISAAQITFFIIVSLITVIFSIHGDLVESLFKRQVSLKDSGHLLPGHGGMLDRIDSLTAASPVFVTGLLLMGDNL